MTAIARREGGAVATSAPKRTLAERLGYEPDTLEFIRQEIANGAPDPQLEYFLRLCQSRGLDPTAREIYYIPRMDNGTRKWTAQIGIDGYRAIAERTGLYDGQDAPTFTFGKDGKLESATVVVYRKGSARGIPGTAYYAEYVQTKDGKPTSMWQKMPRNQLAKCAEALALRKAFPRNLGGLYAAEEMEQAGNVTLDVTPTRTLPEGATRAGQVKGALAQQVAEIEQTPATRIDEEKPAVEQRDFSRMTGEEISGLVADEARARGIEPSELTEIVKRHGGRLTRSSAPAIVAEICEHPIVEGDATEEELPLS
jgi:phage recombination protein Bet